jgi:hypothetical protein
VVLSSRDCSTGSLPCITCKHRSWYIFSGRVLSGAQQWGNVVGGTQRAACTGSCRQRTPCSYSAVSSHVQPCSASCQATLGFLVREGSSGSTFLPNATYCHS